MTWRRLAAQWASRRPTCVRPHSTAAWTSRRPREGLAGCGATGGMRVRVVRSGGAESRWPWTGSWRQSVTVIDPAIESHYGTGYERSRLFPGGRPDGQHRNPDPVGRPEFFTTAYFHTPDGLVAEIERAGFSAPAIYGVEGPGWPLRQEWADPQRHEQILFAARSVETEPSLIGFSDHLIAAATRP